MLRIIKSIVKKNNLLIMLILLLAFILRIYKIQNTPPSLNWDEVSHGYNAYSISKTGSDEWGKKFPIIFKAYGDYKLPGYIYSSIPFISIAGLNEFSVRLPSVIAGLLSVLFAYLLVKKLFKKSNLVSGHENLALLSALLMEI